MEPGVGGNQERKVARRGPQQPRGRAGAPPRLDRENYLDLFEAANDIILMADSNGDVIDINRRAEILTGYTRAELLRMNVLADLVTSEDREQFNLILAGLIAGESQKYEVTWRQKDGGVICLEGNSSARFSQDGRFECTRCILRDITGRKKTERALRTILSGVSGTAGQECFDATAAALCDWLDVECALVGELILGDRVETLALRIDEQRAERISYHLHGTPCENVARRGFCFYPEGVTELFPDDEYLQDLNVQGYVGIPVRNRGGKPVGILCAFGRSRLTVPERCEEVMQILAALVASEVERRRSQEQNSQHRAELAHAWRVNTIGEMAVGLAHELNQPLCAIANYANACTALLTRGVKHAHELRGPLQEIASQATRAGDIIRRIRSLIRRRRPFVTQASVNNAIRSAIDLMTAEAEKIEVEIEADLDPNLPEIGADETELEEVILNLVRNSIEALGPDLGGCRRIIISSGYNGQNEIEVCVSDTGKGLCDSPDIVFDSFYTTKENGMGIGLSICRAIITASGGRIWAENNENGGTTFRFVIPVRLGGPDRE